MMYQSRLKLIGAMVAGTAVAAVTPMLLLAQQNKAVVQEAAAPATVPAAVDPAPAGDVPLIPVIVGIGPNTRDIHPWWTADGSAVESNDLDARRWGGLQGQGVTAYDVLLRWPESPKDVSMIMPGGGGYSRMGKLEYVVIQVPIGQATTTLRIEIATGPWFTLQRMSPLGTGVRNGPGYQAISGQTVQSGADVVSSFVDNFSDMQHRFIAFDKAEQNVLATAADNVAITGNDMFRLYTWSFPNLDKKDIGRLRCDVRPYDTWVEYRNVSLQAGMHSDAKTASGESPSTVFKQLHLEKAPANASLDASPTSPPGGAALP